MDDERYFCYGHAETDYLKERDPVLGDVIDRLGHLEWSVTPDTFRALSYSIIGQQISTAAANSVWARISERLDPLTAEHLAALDVEVIQGCGTSFRKATYVQGIARRIVDGDLDLDRLAMLPDDEVRAQLVKLPGVGEWTAEMVMIFSLERPDVLSAGDAGIQRGLRMLYHHRAITPKLFARYRHRYSPCASVASLYLWEVAGGALSDLRDYRR